MLFTTASGRGEGHEGLSLTRDGRHFGSGVVELHRDQLQADARIGGEAEVGVRLGGDTVHEAEDLGAETGDETNSRIDEDLLLANEDSPAILVDADFALIFEVLEGGPDVGLFHVADVHENADAGAAVLVVVEAEDLVAMVGLDVRDFLGDDREVDDVPGHRAPPLPEHVVDHRDLVSESLDRPGSHHDDGDLEFGGVSLHLDQLVDGR